MHIVLLGGKGSLMIYWLRGAFKVQIVVKKVNENLGEMCKLSCLGQVSGLILRVQVKMLYFEEPQSKLC